MTDNENHDLKKILDSMHDGISSVVAVSNDLLSLNKDNTITDILDTLIEKLKILNYFDSFAFYEVKDLIDFERTHCYPAIEAEQIEKDVEAHIDNGTFAWALNNTNPVVVSGTVSGNNQVLFSLSTKRCIHGMFIANAKDKGNISGVTLDILQLLLTITVFSIDNLNLTEQLTDYASNLEKKVSERTVELEAEKLNAEQSSKARSEFLANMSHEIRTPMNGVLGMMELLKVTELNEKQLNYVNTAQNSGNNMMVILNDILDLSKYESGKLTLEEEEFNVVDTIDDLASLFSLDLQAKGVDLLVYLDPEIPTFVYGGKTRFWQVIMNLLGNAKKFTESGDISLSLKLNRVESDELEILVSIKDSGIGMPEESLGKIFDSFEQAEANTTRKYGGTGLGLALCKRLTQMMGGDVHVKSILGEGSEFYFTVKFKRITEEKNEYPFEQETLDKTNIVYIDDKTKQSIIAESIFKRLNLNFEIFASLENILSLPDFCTNTNNKNNILFVDEATLSKDPASQEKLSKLIHQSINVAVICTEATKVNYKGIFNTLVKPLQTKQVYEYVQSTVEEKYVLFDDDDESEAINANVLLVEDNEVNQMVAKGMLDNMGCNVFITENGLIALDALKDYKFDVVLMDINMPVLNGYDATQQYRLTEAEGEHIPIIALTANVLAEDVKRYFDVGMDDYMSKPFSAEKLREIIRKWVPAEIKKEVIEQNVISEEQKEEVDVEIEAEVQVDAKIENNNLLPDYAVLNVDVNTISNLKNMMSDGYIELVGTYLSRSLELKNSILTNSDNIEKLISDVHSLKGSSGTMGATKLFSICENFELLLREGVLTNQESEVEKISNEHDNFCYFLRNETL